MKHTLKYFLVLAAMSLAGSGTVWGATTSRAILPLVPGWHNGSQVLYIQTEASDAAVAQSQDVNYVPRLGDAAEKSTVDDIYVFTNFQQANVVPSAPNPLGPMNTDTNYTPLWQVSTVSWNNGATPQLLTSEADILSSASMGKVTINKTRIIVNCPMIFTPEGGALPTATIIGPTEQKSVILPLVNGWFRGAPVLYLQTEASDLSVAQSQNVNYVSHLSGAADGTTVDDIYVFSNFQQANIIPSAPNPLGPQNADLDYSPLWQVSVVAWNDGFTPQVLKSQEAVMDGVSSGKLTITRTHIIVNCPVMAFAAPTVKIIGAPAVLGAVKSLSSGGLQLTLNGQAGLTYPVQASTNLTDWLAVANVTLTNSSAQFTDPSAANLPWRFYRAIDQ